MVGVRRLLAPLLSPLQLSAGFVWTACWVTVALVGQAVTWNRDVALVLARRVWAPGILALVGARLTVTGGAGLEPGRPYVYVMNHQSAIDIPAAFAALPSNLRFVAKHVLAYVPFLGAYMWATGMIFVNRNQRSRALRSLRAAAARIRGGVCILAYPEGTRSRDGRILPFQKGSFVLAGEAGVPIVPVAIEGSRDVMRPGSFRFLPAAVRVAIGAPIATAGVPREELMRRVRAEVIALHRSIGGAGGEAGDAGEGARTDGAGPARVA